MSSAFEILTAHPADHPAGPAFVHGESPDPRVWRLSRDYVDAAPVAVLPLHGDPPVHVYHRHRLRASGWTYRDEPCLTGCPFCAHVQTHGALWNAKTTRRVTFNAVILRDAVHPDHVGQVRLVELPTDGLIDQFTSLCKHSDVFSGYVVFLHATQKGSLPSYRVSLSHDTTTLAYAAGRLQTTPDALLTARHDLSSYPQRDPDDQLRSFLRLKLKGSHR